jgi:ribosomal protein S18 acetylase RimI-like enzyme
MHQEMGNDASDPRYRAAAEEAFARRLDADPRFVAFLVQDEGRTVSCGVGHLEEHLPSPSQLDGRRGHISSMSTEGAARRQGHARAVLGALMGWMGEQGVGRVDLRATPDGQPLYAAVGFRVLGGATMSWTAPGVRPGMPLHHDGPEAGAGGGADDGDGEGETWRR